jgi:hypothetical protein
LARQYLDAETFVTLLNFFSKELHAERLIRADAIFSDLLLLE